MPTYFGEQANTNYTIFNGANVATFWNNPGVTVFTCPGVGNQQIVELSAYCHASAGGSSRIRLAVYSTDLSTLIAQGTAYVVVDPYTSWKGHLSASVITPNPALLVGGQNYVLAVTENPEADTFSLGYHYTGASNLDQVAYADYTGGFPSSLTPYTNLSYSYEIRCGVIPAPQSYVLNAGCAQFSEVVNAIRAVRAQNLMASPASFGFTPYAISVLKALSIPLGMVNFALTAESMNVLRNVTILQAGVAAFSLGLPSTNFQRVLHALLGARTFSYTPENITVLRAVKIAQIANAVFHATAPPTIFLRSPYYRTVTQEWYGREV